MKRILYLCKRLYMRKDVILDRYGRLDQFPRFLRAQGFQVDAMTLAYRWGKAWRQRTPEWTSYDMGQVLTGRYLKDTRQAANITDCILSSSDSLHLAYANWLRRVTGKRLVVDLYDNYESFGLTRLPGLRSQYREALQAASLVTCVSETLCRHLRGSLHVKGDLIVVPSTVDTRRFYPLDKHDCRERLKLPQGKLLIGLSGHLSLRRGAFTVLEAVQRLRQRGIPACLAAAGASTRQFRRSVSDSVYLTGALSHEQMNLFYNAVDLNVVHVTDDDFGRFSFPQKLYEIVATSSPIAASRIGAVGDVLQDYPRMLYDPTDVDDIASVILSQIEQRRIADIRIPGWYEVLDPVADWLNNR